MITMMMQQEVIVATNEVKMTRDIMVMAENGAVRMVVVMMAR